MPLESEFVIQNALISSTILKKIDGELSMHGISFTEYMVMHHLSMSALKTMRRIELAECIGISASGITRVIKPMEKNNIVEKEANPRDARQSLVKLSKVGDKLYRDASVSFEHRAKAILEPLSHNQLEKLVELADKLR